MADDLTAATACDRLVIGDCVVGMRGMASRSVDAAIADPPFGIGRKYPTCDDNLEYDDYLAWSRSWLAEVSRVLSDTGTLWLCIGTRYSSELDVMCRRELGFHKRANIIWYYTFGQNQRRNFSRSHTPIFLYSKHKTDFTWNDSAIRVPSARQLIYKDKRANSAGRLPDDVWILRPQAAAAGFTPDLDVQHVPRVCGTFRERQGTDNQMPEQLVERMLRVSTNPGDLVLSPFGGSGTDAAVAKRLGRRWIMFELASEYAVAAAARIAAVVPEGVANAAI